MYVKEDLVLPHNLSFYDLIISKARGKSGPLFHFDVYDDVRLEHNANVEKEESHAGKACSLAANVDYTTCDINSQQKICFWSSRLHMYQYTVTCVVQQKLQAMFCIIGMCSTVASISPVRQSINCFSCFCRQGVCTSLV